MIQNTGLNHKRQELGDENQVQYIARLGAIADYATIRYLNALGRGKKPIFFFEEGPRLGQEAIRDAFIQRLRSNLTTSLEYDEKAMEVNGFRNLTVFDPKLFEAVEKESSSSQPTLYPFFPTLSILQTYQGPKHQQHRALTTYLRDKQTTKIWRLVNVHLFAPDTRLPENRNPSSYDSFVGDIQRFISTPGTDYTLFAGDFNINPKRYYSLPASLAAQVATTSSGAFTEIDGIIFGNTNSSYQRPITPPAAAAIEEPPLTTSRHSSSEELEQRAQTEIQQLSASLSGITYTTDTLRQKIDELKQEEAQIKLNMTTWPQPDFIKSYEENLFILNRKILYLEHLLSSAPFPPYLLASLQQHLFSLTSTQQPSSLSLPPIGSLVTTGTSSPETFVSYAQDNIPASVSATAVSPEEIELKTLKELLSNIEKREEEVLNGMIELNTTIQDLASSRGDSYADKDIQDLMEKIEILAAEQTRVLQEKLKLKEEIQEKETSLIRDEYFQPGFD